MSRRANESMEAGQYPERPGELDCAYYMRTGLCRFGMSCRFNHPPNRKLVTWLLLLNCYLLDFKYVYVLVWSCVVGFLMYSTTRFLSFACSFYSPTNSLKFVCVETTNMVRYIMQLQLLNLEAISCSSRVWFSCIILPNEGLLITLIKFSSLWSVLLSLAWSLSTSLLSCIFQSLNLPSFGGYDNIWQRIMMGWSSGKLYRFIMRGYVCFFTSFLKIQCLLNLSIFFLYLLV